MPISRIVVHPYFATYVVDASIREVVNPNDALHKPIVKKAAPLLLFVHQHLEAPILGNFSRESICQHSSTD